MFVVDSPAWTQIAVPNLPMKHRDEYVLRLAEFAPKTPWLKADQVGLGQIYYAFPFVQIPETFPSLDYDDYVISVEKKMMELYPDEITEESFTFTE